MSESAAAPTISWFEITAGIFPIVVGGALALTVAGKLSIPRENAHILSRPRPDADLAISPVMHLYQLATTPKPIDAEDQVAFFDRWMSIFANAASGTLT